MRATTSNHPTLSIETILALFLGDWITHRDGIEQRCLQTLLSVRDAAA